MVCPQCHTENPEGSRFCYACGSALTAAPAPGIPTPPPLRRHVSPTGKAVLVGLVLVAVIGVVALGAAALSFMRPAVHPGAAASGGIRPPAIQPGPVVPAAPVAPSTAPVAPIQPALPVTPTAPVGAAPVSPTTPPSVQRALAHGSAPTPAVTPPAARPAPHPGAAAPAPVPPRPAAPPSPAAPSQRVAAFQRYRAPSGWFVISYPQDWRYQEDVKQDAVVFFKDDPDEGTSFGMALQPLQAPVTAQYVLNQWVANFRRQYPDLTTTARNLDTTPKGGAAAQTLVADASWTGVYRQAMRARLVIRTWTAPGSGRPWFFLMGGQAPAITFQAVLPIYVHMADSLSF